MILHEAKNEHGSPTEPWSPVDSMPMEMLALTPCHFNGADSGESFTDAGSSAFPMPLWSPVETYSLSDTDDDEDDMEEDDFDDMEEEDFDDDEDDFDEDEDDDDDEDDFDEDDDYDYDEDDDFEDDEE